MRTRTDLRFWRSHLSPLRIQASQTSGAINMTVARASKPSKTGFSHTKPINWSSPRCAQQAFNCLTWAAKVLPPFESRRVPQVYRRQVHQKVSAEDLALLVFRQGFPVILHLKETSPLRSPKLRLQAPLLNSGPHTSRPRPPCKSAFTESPVPGWRLQYTFSAAPPHRRHLQPPEGSVSVGLLLSRQLPGSGFASAICFAWFLSSFLLPVGAVQWCHEFA